MKIMIMVMVVEDLRDERGAIPMPPVRDTMPRDRNVYAMRDHRKMVTEERWIDDLLDELDRLG